MEFQNSREGKGRLQQRDTGIRRQKHEHSLDFAVLTKETDVL